MILAVEEPGVHGGLDLFLPTWPDVLWSAAVLLIISFAFYRFIMPKFMGVLDQRAAMIDGGIKQAEQVRAAAQATLAERHQMLEEAQIEAAKTRDAARAEGEVIIKERKEAAAREAARIEAQAQRNLEAQRQLAETQLRADVGHLATQLAGKIIGASLTNEATKADTIDRFIDELEGAQLHGQAAQGGDAWQGGTDFGDNGVISNIGGEMGQDIESPELAELTDATESLNGSSEPIVSTVVKERRHFFRK